MGRATAANDEEAPGLSHAQPHRGRTTIDNRPARPVSVPELAFLKAPLIDDGAERREIAARFAEPHRCQRP